MNIWDDPPLDDPSVKSMDVKDLKESSQTYIEFDGSFYGRIPENNNTGMSSMVLRINGLFHPYIGCLRPVNRL